MFCFSGVWKHLLHLKLSGEGTDWRVEEDIPGPTVWRIAFESSIPKQKLWKRSKLISSGAVRGGTLSSVWSSDGLCRPLRLHRALGSAACVIITC